MQSNEVNNYPKVAWCLDVSSWSNHHPIIKNNQLIVQIEQLLNSQEGNCLALLNLHRFHWWGGHFCLNLRSLRRGRRFRQRRRLGRRHGSHFGPRRGPLPLLHRLHVVTGEVEGANGCQQSDATCTTVACGMCWSLVLNVYCIPLYPEYLIIWHNLEHVVKYMTHLKYNCQGRLKCRKIMKIQC